MKQIKTLSIINQNWQKRQMNKQIFCLSYKKIKKMESYFSAIQPHLQDKVDIALISTTQSLSARAIASLGIDSLIYVRDVQSEQQNRVYLPENSNYQCIAASGNHDSCVLGSESGAVEDFNLQTQKTKLVYKSEYKINSLTNSPTKKYLAIASEESKCILIDMNTLRSSKCRPGHESGVSNAVFSEDQKFLASIGMDKTLFIYTIENFDQPIEKFHIKLCKVESIDSSLLRGCFHKLLHIFYAPGMKQLQIVQLLNNKWEYRLSKFIKHSTEVIQLVKILKTSLLATGSANEFMIWNNKTEEKIVVVDNFTLNKIVEVNNTFWGCKHDGRIFSYKKVLNQVIGGDANQQLPQKMEIQQENGTRLNIDKSNQDVLVFDDDAQQQGNQQEDQEKSIQSQVCYQQVKKKSIADKLIKAYPQQAVSTRTSQFDNAYYLRTSHQGYLVFKNEAEFDKLIDFEIEDKPTEHLFVNKEILFCDFNSQFVAYANETQYGVKFLKSVQNRCFDDAESWEKHWQDITAIACSYQWVAVANDEEIKILDVMGNQIKNIAFDRIIVAMAAYENLLAVVYHQTIPIEGAQCLSMQLYVINHESTEVLKCSTCHVPIKRKALLKFFRFSNEGMLVTHDDAGYIRVYNLENNTWTSVIVEGVEDTRRIWLLGMQNYQIVYWKTSELNPDPEVFPRLPVKTSRLGTNIATQDTQRMREYPFLMFQRFCLDHEKSRSRLWGALKQARTQKYPGYIENISTILTPGQIAKHHNQLDFKFFEFIKFYLENPKTHQKALTAVKTLIRTIEVGKTFIEIFDNINQRGLAVELEIYYEQKEKQLEYEAMQKLELENLRIQAEKQIKPKGTNNPFNKKKNNDFSSIPSLNTSQMSQGSNFDNLSERSAFKGAKENGMKMANKPIITETPPKEKQEAVNPFLRKKTTDDDANMKVKQIEEQIERHGIKKKAEVPKKLNNNKF